MRSKPPAPFWVELSENDQIQNKTEMKGKLMPSPQSKHENASLEEGVVTQMASHFMLLFVVARLLMLFELADAKNE